MSYAVESVRYTHTCDACGLVAKWDRDAGLPVELEPLDWQTVRVGNYQFHCCPACCALVHEVLTRGARAERERKEQAQAACEHDYQQRGLLRQCVKCEQWWRHELPKEKKT